VAEELSFSIRGFKTLPDDWMEDGYRRAAERVRAAAPDFSKGTARDIAIAIFDAVMWVGAIAEKRGLEGDTRVQALRHVRDRMFHGAGSPTDPDEEAGTRRWVGSDNLPPPTDDRPEPRRRFYDEHLAGRSVVEIFDYFEERL
jgi:hypothetical protein